MMARVLVISFGLFFFTVGLVGADVPGAQEALTHMDAALVEIGSAEKHAKQRHADEISNHSNQAIQHAKKAIEVMPTGNPHGKEAASLLKEAIASLAEAVKFVNGGQTKKAIELVYSALDFADAAITHLRHAH